jgi:hypothetical protein
MIFCMAQKNQPEAKNSFSGTDIFLSDIIIMKNKSILIDSFDQQKN